MEKTVGKSIESIAKQLDDRFELIVVDGGSSDNSIFEIKKVQASYPLIRLYQLKRDRSRKIGKDRNISVNLAKGKYVLLNLDCDDLYGEHILDWVKCFHLIEKKFKFDVLVSGKHINMVSRSFFSSVGGFKNIRYEDRDLWMRCASLDRWVSWEHKDFVIRLPRNNRQRIYKNTFEPAYGVLSDFQHGLTFRQTVNIRLSELRANFGRVTLIKLLLAVPLFLVSLSLEKLRNDHRFNPVSFSEYKKDNTKTLMEITGLDKETLKEHLTDAGAQEIFLCDTK